MKRKIDAKKFLYAMIGALIGIIVFQYVIIRALLSIPAPTQIVIEAPVTVVAATMILQPENNMDIAMGLCNEDITLHDFQPELAYIPTYAATIKFENDDNYYSCPINEEMPENIQFRPDEEIHVLEALSRVCKGNPALADFYLSKTFGVSCDPYRNPEAILSAISTVQPAQERYRNCSYVFYNRDDVAFLLFGDSFTSWMINGQRFTWVEKNTIKEINDSDDKSNLLKVFNAVPYGAPTCTPEP